MSVIAVKNIPYRVCIHFNEFFSIFYIVCFVPNKCLLIQCSLPQLVKLVAKAVQGQFEAVNFVNDKHGEKKCYLRLSERLDPQQVVKRVRTMTKFGAFVPDHVPDVSLYNISI